MEEKTTDYILGGEFPGYIMIPNMESLKEYCKKELGRWYYMGHEIKRDDLILLEFPAYFRLSADKMWEKVDYTRLTWQLDKAIADHEDYAEGLRSFRDAVNSPLNREV